MDHCRRRAHDRDMPPTRRSRSWPIESVVRASHGRRSLGVLSATVGTVLGIGLGTAAVVLLDPWHDLDQLLLSFLFVLFGEWLGGVVGCYAALVIVQDESAARTAAVVAGLLPPAAAFALFVALPVTRRVAGQFGLLLVVEMAVIIVIVAAVCSSAYLVSNEAVPRRGGSS